MAEREGGSNAVIGVVLGAILVLLIVFIFFGGFGVFRADDPADVDVQVETPDAPEAPEVIEAPEPEAPAE
jgi:hypothetical protein